MKEKIMDVIETALIEAGFEVIGGEKNSMLVLPSEGKDNFVVRVGESA